VNIMCISSKLEISKAFIDGLAKFKEDNPSFFKELKSDPNKEALIELGNVLIPFTFSEIETRKQEIISASIDAISTTPTIVEPTLLQVISNA